MYKRGIFGKNVENDLFNVDFSKIRVFYTLQIVVLYYVTTIFCVVILLLKKT